MGGPVVRSAAAAPACFAGDDAGTASLPLAVEAWPSCRPLGRFRRRMPGGDGAGGSVRRFVVLTDAWQMNAVRQHPGMAVEQRHVHQQDPGGDHRQAKQAAQGKPQPMPGDGRPAENGPEDQRGQQEKSFGARVDGQRQGDAGRRRTTRASTPGPRHPR